VSSWERPGPHPPRASTCRSVRDAVIAPISTTPAASTYSGRYIRGCSRAGRSSLTLATVTVACTSQVGQAESHGGKVKGGMRYTIPPHTFASEAQLAQCCLGPPKRLSLHAVCGLRRNAESLRDFHPTARWEPVQTIAHSQDFALSTTNHGKYEEHLIAGLLDHTSFPLCLLGLWQHSLPHASRRFFAPI
jgi:hypothetical protein